MGSSPQDLNTDDLMVLFRHLRAERQRRKTAQCQPRKGRLTPQDPEHILRKTGSRCHVCGGLLENVWQADHVLAHSGGGGHDRDNYLPAHPLCNSYRWDYTAGEFQYILKLGVWLRTQIEKNTVIGREAAGRFLVYERRRALRWKQ